MTNTIRVASPRVMAIAAALICLMIIAAIADESPPGYWTQKAPLPASRAEVAAVALDAGARHGFRPTRSRRA